MSDNSGQQRLQAFESKIQAVRNVGKLRRTKTDTLAQVKPQRKERRATDIGFTAMSVQEGGEKRKERRSTSNTKVDLSNLSALADMKIEKNTKLEIQFVTKSMKDMEPDKVIALLESYAGADSDRAAQCLQCLKNSSESSKPRRTLLRRTKSGSGGVIRSKSAKSA